MFLTSDACTFSFSRGCYATKYDNRHGSLFDKLPSLPSAAMGVPKGPYSTTTTTTTTAAAAAVTVKFAYNPAAAEPFIFGSMRRKKEGERKDEKKRKKKVRNSTGRELEHECGPSVGGPRRDDVFIDLMSRSYTSRSLLKLSPENKDPR